MSEHATVGKLYELDDAAMQKQADMAQAEWEEISTRYGMQAFLAIGAMRQKGESAEPSEDVELFGTAQGCAHCLPFFLARLVVRNPRMAEILADTLRWIDKMREDPEARPLDLEVMAISGPKQ